MRDDSCCSYRHSPYCADFNQLWRHEEYSYKKIFNYNQEDSSHIQIKNIQNSFCVREIQGVINDHQNFISFFINIYTIIFRVFKIVGLKYWAFYVNFFIYYYYINFIFICTSENLRLWLMRFNSTLD